MSIEMPEPIALTPEMMATILDEWREELIPTSPSGRAWLKMVMFGAGQTSCSICETPLDLNLKHPHPASVQLDHIIPISRPGGTNSVSNLQLAHMYCNGSKNDDRVPGYPSPEQARWWLARKVRETDEPGWIAPRVSPEENAKYSYTWEQYEAGAYHWAPALRPFLEGKGWISPERFAELRAGWAPKSLGNDGG